MPPIKPCPEIVQYNETEWQQLGVEQRRNIRIWAEVAEEKLSRGCSRCGYDEHPSALSFHHLDPDEKSFELNQAHYYSQDRVRSEMEKCEVVCRNCHAVEHYDGRFKCPGE